MQGDIGNLKAFSKRFRDALPVDYYKASLTQQRAVPEGARRRAAIKI